MSTVDIMQQVLIGVLAIGQVITARAIWLSNHPR